MKVRKTICLILAFVLITALVPAAAGEEDPPALTADITVLKSGLNTEDAQTVWFGGKAWRIIGYDGEGAASAAGAMTLFAGENFEHTTFRNESNNEYAGSLLQQAVDGIASNIPAAEKNAIVKRTLVSGQYDGENTDCVAGPEVKDAVLWPLSTKEAFEINDSLRIADPEHLSWLISFWWLRSPGEDYLVAVVFPDGQVELLGFTSMNDIGVRPAMYIDLNSVLFASSAAGGKKTTLGELSPVSSNESSEWKLTLLDPARGDFTAKAVSLSGDVLTVKYGGAKTGMDEKISAIIVNESGEITYYGALCKAKSGPEQTVTVDLAGKYGKGDALYVFNELTVAGKRSDYASALQLIGGIDYGDSNGDKEVDGKDLIRLRKYLLDDGIVIFPGADVNADGTVDGKDLIRLRKYLLSEDESLLGSE